MSGFHQNREITYIPNKYVAENTFIGKNIKKVNIPEFDAIKGSLPKPVWTEHSTAIDCYYKAWEIAFSNINNPKDGSGFVSPFIDAAFNGHIFMWDSCFMLMFGKYATDIFNFQETLDNFYALQHKDGFISREIREDDGAEQFTRFDPASTGPNVMPWCEYDYYKFTGDIGRVEKVFPALLAYHQWMKRYRTWRDGSYWSCGWGCGMDNQPRLKGDATLEERYFSNGNMIWVDACMQQLISCNVLIKMAKLCNRSEEISDIYDEKETLSKLLNEKLWDNNTKFYYDLWDDNSLNMVKSVGAYWALLAEVVPEENLDDFVQHLKNKNEFNRYTRVPTLSADNKCYDAGGNYWCGSVWAPTNYMVLKGLSENDYDKLAFEIAYNCVLNVVKTFEDTGTIWENYAPETSQKGSIAKKDFVGWSGLFPISILIEYVFGIKVNADKNEIIWNINLTDEFGIENLPFGVLGKVDLRCLARNSLEEKPEIQVKSDVDFTLKVKWCDKLETIYVKANDNIF